MSSQQFSRQSVYVRLSLALLLTFLLIGVFSILLFMRSSRAYQQEVTQIMHRDLAAFVVDHYLLFRDEKPDLAAAKQTFHDLMVLGPNFEFYLLDKEGNILAYSTDPTKIKRKRVDVTPLQHFTDRDKYTEIIYGDDPRSSLHQKVFTAAPVYHKGILLGYLYVILGSEIYDDIASMVSDSKIIQWGIWIFLLGLGFSLVAMLWVISTIIRPLERLTQHVKAVQETGFETLKISPVERNMEPISLWQAGVNNEIHTLGNAFHALLEKLHEQYQNVITVDQLRKELLSHISHDLRTPLASLLGYLETWELNRNRVTEQESAQYIAVARKSAQRISNLIEQLFELAHLDSGMVQVNREPLSLPELVQDVLQKFQILAQEKQLVLAVEPKDSSIRVMGDVEKLDRVFSNLIDNAIRHTKPGGSIVVRISPESRAVAVEVTDTGIGIPEPDMPHIFDPHYKAGNSVRGNTAHGGLGLAITQKLLALHHSHIQVRSCENQGTTFWFELEPA